MTGYIWEEPPVLDESRALYKTPVRVQIFCLKQRNSGGQFVEIETGDRQYADIQKSIIFC